MGSFSALASEAVCLNASRMLAGRDRSDERQNHNDDPGHRSASTSRFRRPVHQMANLAHAAPSWVRARILETDWCEIVNPCARRWLRIRIKLAPRSRIRRIVTIASCCAGSGTK